MPWTYCAPYEGALSSDMVYGIIEISGITSCISWNAVSYNSHNSLSTMSQQSPGPRSSWTHR
jgi:hypothetical protein